MKNFSRKGSSGYLNYSDSYSDSDEKIYDNFYHSSGSKKKFTDIICGLINYASLIITLAYNIFWVITFHQILPKLEEEHISNCQDTYNWNNYYYIWTVISLTKALVFLLCAKFGSGSEFDCNFFCLLIKTLTSLIPCIFFVIKIPYYGPNTFDKEIDKNCFTLYDNLARFYRYETYYLIFVVAISLSPIIGASAMALKEYIKSL